MYPTACMTHLLLLSSFLGKQLGVVLVGKLLGLHQEVPQVLLEYRKVLVVEHARHARLQNRHRWPLVHDVR